MSLTSSTSAGPTHLQGACDACFMNFNHADLLISKSLAWGLAVDCEVHFAVAEPQETFLWCTTEHVQARETAECSHGIYSLMPDEIFPYSKFSFSDSCVM